MTLAMATQKVAMQSKEYEVGDHVYGVVSAKAMGHIEAARRKCGNGDPWKLLQTVADATKGDDEVLMGLYVYGRFEFDLHPRELGEFYRRRISYTGGSAFLIREICMNAAHYWVKVDPRSRRH